MLMAPTELEAYFRPKMRRILAVRLLPVKDVVDLLTEADPEELTLLGVEAFKMH